MKTWSDIAKLLNQEIPEGLIMPANAQAGIYGAWIKGSVAMELANVIFGPDGWSTEVVSQPHITQLTVGVGQGGEARGGIIVQAGVMVTAYGLIEGDIIAVSKQDVGWGTAAASYDRKSGAYLPIKPAQYRAAIMGSVTLGIKRCLRQFGRHLGMQLYFPDEAQMVAVGWESEGAPEDAPKKKSTKSETKKEPVDSSWIASFFGLSATPPADFVETATQFRADGKTQVRAKKVQEQLGEAATVADVYREMTGYAVWMCEAATKGSQGAAFQAMFQYDKLSSKLYSRAYALEGGDFVPWDGLGIRHPGIMVGYATERSAYANKKFRQALIDRFPAADTEQGMNIFHLKNHLTKHFQVERIALLIWEQMAAFRGHIINDIEYPSRFGGTEDEEEPQLQTEAEPEPKKDHLDYLEKIVHLAEQIDESLEPLDEWEVAALMAKYPASAQVLSVLEDVAEAIEAGHLKEAAAVKIIMETALKGLGE